MRKTKNSVGSGVVSKATPLPPHTSGKWDTVNEISTVGLTQSEIVAIALSIGDPSVIPDLFALCIPRANPQDTTPDTPMPIAVSTISEVG